MTVRTLISEDMATQLVITRDLVYRMISLLDYCYRLGVEAAREVDDEGLAREFLGRTQQAGVYQSNHEGAIIDEIHAADGVYDAIVINPGAYTHYSYAILDALKAVDVPAYEVHISHIDQREPFRAVSVTAPACVGQLYGYGFQGYLMAMDYFLEGGR